MYFASVSILSRCNFVVSFLFRDSEKSKLQSNNSEANKDVKNETPNNDNAGAETKKKGQRLKIEEIESINDVIIQNRVQDVGPVNEKSKEKSQPETVEKSELDTSEKILEDLKVINSVKEEEEGMSLDNLVNGETVVSFLDEFIS